MFRGAPVQPLAVAPRVMPEDTVPVTGAMPPMSRDVAATTLHNPLAADPYRVARGAKLFAMQCAPCHGASGKGDSPVKSILNFSPDDLTSAKMKARSDAYIFATIRDGASHMPALADAMSVEETWEVVLYVRSIEERAASASQ